MRFYVENSGCERCSCRHPNFHKHFLLDGFRQVFVTYRLHDGGRYYASVYYNFVHMHVVGGRLG